MTVPQIAVKLDEMGRWEKMVRPLAIRLADRRPGTYRSLCDGRPVVWGTLQTEVDLVKKHGPPQSREKGRYGFLLLWRRIKGARNLSCGWKMAYCGPHGSLVWGDGIDVLGGKRDEKAG